MDLLVDAYWWRSGPPSGRSVVRDIVLAWVHTFQGDRVTLAVPHSDVSAVGEEIGHDVRIVGLRSRPHGVAVAVELSWLARRGNFDAVLTQNFRAFGSRSGVFVHDALFMSNPEWFTRKELAYLAWIPRLIGPKAVVFTSSINESRRLEAFLRHTPVHAVGLAVPSDLREAMPVRPRALPSDRFVLTVGRLNVRKNLGTAVDGALKSGVLSTNCPLVIVGESSGALEELPEAVKTATESGLVHFLGGVTPGELRWLYEHGQTLVCMSLDEGFGLPPLEAQTFGMPSVVSDIPVFRELYGDTAELASPRDARSIADALRRAAAHPRRKPDPGPAWRDVVLRIRQGLEA